LNENGSAACWCPGVDSDVVGDVWRRPGLKFKYLTQEPQLDYDLDVQGAQQGTQKRHGHPLTNKTKACLEVAV
jgi:hypothetical protein